MLRLHASSAGVDPAALVPGEDLVLELHPAHGTDAPDGTYVFDHVPAAARRGIDLAVLDALKAWRARLDAPLTEAGVCWPFVWHSELYRLLIPLVARALALRDAVQALEPDEIVLTQRDAPSARLAEAVGGVAIAAGGTLPLTQAVGAATGVPVRVDPAAAPARPARAMPPAVPALRRARRAALGTVTRFGAPSWTRSDSVLFRSFWPLMPLFDRVLSDADLRPAVFLDQRPVGVGRTLRAAVQGGWVGIPTEVDRLRSRRAAQRMVDAVHDDPSFEVDGLELGGLLQRLLTEFVEGRAVNDLAHARMLRRAFRRRRPAWLVVPFDVVPEARLRVLLAREAGIRSLGVAHGAFVLPEPYADLDQCDEVALWTDALGPALLKRAHVVHRLGYPMPHDVPPPTRPAPDRAPRIAVLGQLPVNITATIDERITMRTYEAALRAVARHRPDATVVLRPHPVEDRAAVPEAVRRFPALDVRVEPSVPILDLLRAVDLCIGGATLATLQAALVGTPIVVLNLSSHDWRHPIGGTTVVPVARSSEQLAEVLASWTPGTVLPGRDDVVAALGADGRNEADARLLSILRRSTEAVQPTLRQVRPDP